MKNNIKTGSAGETLAANFLKNKGYKIIEKNWRYSRLGEIDIIASFKNDLIFIEVKTRSSVNFGHPLESINNTKFNKIKKLAEAYINSNNTENYDNYRFDIIGIIMNKNPEIVHYENIME